MKISDSQYSAALLNSLSESLYLKAADELMLINDHIDKIYLYISNPTIATKQKISSLVSIGFDPQIINFLLIVSSVKDIDGMNKTLVNVIKNIYKKMGVIQTTVVSAHKLTNENISNIKDKIKNISKKDVIINEVVNKEILGGIKIYFEDYLYDASLMSSLNTLKISLLK